MAIADSWLAEIALMPVRRNQPQRLHTHYGQQEILDNQLSFDVNYRERWYVAQVTSQSTFNVNCWERRYAAQATSQSTFNVNWPAYEVGAYRLWYKNTRGETCRRNITRLAIRISYTPVAVANDT
jgi:hypothetical protein